MLEALKENPHSIGAENKLPIMKEKFNEATQQRPDGGGLIDAPMVTIDLPAFMQQIKQEAEHVVELSKGQIIVLHKHIPHSVLAKEESIFMLTLTTTLAEIK